MASDEAISGALAFLHELFPTRAVGPATLDAWSVVFADWSDAQVHDCAVRAARETGRVFFPTPGEIIAHRSVAPVRALDTEGLLKRIGALGSYDPRTGWCWPSLEKVRIEIGAAEATAYGLVGPSRLFSDTANTRDIAQRDFTRALGEAVGRAGPATVALPVERRDELANPDASPHSVSRAAT